MQTDVEVLLIRLQKLAIGTGVCMVAFGAQASGLTFGSGTYGSCSYNNCSITISTSGTVSLNVVPTASGKCSVQEDSVAVTTDDSSGFMLSLADTATNSALTDGSQSLPTSSGTLAMPATLSNDTWGYRVDGIGGFGAGPTTAQTNATLGSMLFAGLQNSLGTPDTIANTSVVADPAVVTPVWYGVCADTTITDGTYTGQVLYTAVTN
jgi:hypothetical protein